MKTLLTFGIVSILCVLTLATVAFCADVPAANSTWVEGHWVVVEGQTVWIKGYWTTSPQQRPQTQPQQQTQVVYVQQPAPTVIYVQQPQPRVVYVQQPSTFMSFGYFGGYYGGGCYHGGHRHSHISIHGSFVR